VDAALRLGAGMAGSGLFLHGHQGQQFMQGVQSNKQSDSSLTIP
jgi:hypothetical protein